MLRRALPTVLAVVAILALGLAFLGEGSAQTRSAGAGQQVEVVNFPENQDVTVRGTPSQARLAGFEDQLISPNGSRDPTTWRQIGTLATDGFGWVVLSLGGNVQGPVTEPGAVVAVLVPEQAPILRALRDDQVVLFPLQATATLSPGREYFTSQQQRQPVAFPRYQVYLYNTGARTVEASLWAYLGN
jgi:hypothetical protein